MFVTLRCQDLVRSLVTMIFRQFTVRFNLAKCTPVQAGPIQRGLCVPDGYFHTDSVNV